MSDPKSYPVPRIVPEDSTSLATGGMPWSPSAASNLWLDTPQESAGLNFTRFLHSFRRKWLWGTLAGLILAPLTAGLLWFLIPVRHQAEGLVRVNMSEREILPDMIGRQAPNQQEFESFKETQVELMKSPLILESVLRKDDIQKLNMIRREGDGLAQRAMLNRKLSVTTNPKAEIIKISLTGNNEDEVKKIVDGVMDSYLAEAIQSERSFRSEALQTLVDQKASNDKQMLEGYKQIDSLATRYGTEDSKMAEMKKDVAHQELQSILRTKEEIETELQNLQVEYFVLENKRRNKSIKPDEMMIEDELEKDESYMEMKQMLSDLEQQIASSSGAMRTGSATATRFQGQIQSIRESLAKRRAEMEPRVRERLRRINYGDDQIAISTKIAELQTAIQVANARSKKVQEELSEKKAELEKLSGFSAELEARKKFVESLEEANDRIAGEIQRLELQMKKPPRVSRIQPATIPHTFANLIRLLSIGLASVIVFGLSLVGTAFQDYVQNLLSTAGELEKETNLPVLGTIPAMVGNARQREFLAATSVDSIRAAITRGDRAKDMNSVMVTSAVVKEGKSTVASQLAVSLARGGRRTVLVDGDIRHPQLHLFFGLPGDRGVCDVLRGEANVDELIQTTPSENLWVLPAGRVDVNSFQSLSGQSVGEMIDRLRQQFDFVVIDTAPVLTGPEPLLFGQYVQGTVITARKDVSCIDKVDEAFRRLQSVGIRVLGSVILGGKTEVRADRLALPAAS